MINKQGQGLGALFLFCFALICKLYKKYIDNIGKVE